MGIGARRNGRDVVETVSTERKMTSTTHPTMMIKKTILKKSKGAKSRTWGRKTKKLMGDLKSDSSQPGIRGFLFNEVIGLDLSQKGRLNSHGNY